LFHYNIPQLRGFRGMCQPRVEESSTSLSHQSAGPDQNAPMQFYGLGVFAVGTKQDRYIDLLRNKRSFVNKDWSV
jgi:hypothetical protein